MIPLTYTLVIAAILLLPGLLAGLLRRRFAAPWLLFSVGMLTFGLSQAVHLPLNHWLSGLGVLPSAQEGTLQGARLWQAALVLGLTAGLCEELARTAGYAVLRRFPALASQTSGGGILLGLGHGGIEAIVFGGVLTAAAVSALLPLIGQDLNGLNLPALQQTALETQLAAMQSPIQALLPLVERLLAVGLHVAFSLMVLRACQKRQPLWVAGAVVYHTLVNGILVVAAVQLDNLWLVELLLLALALPGYGFVVWTVRQAGEPAPPAQPWQREVSVFTTALRKELFQAWRTRRVFVICVVFAAFGMLSPLLAYFTPELLKSIPGAEAFAALIPPANAGDAMQQYHKNLTQFGFILAVVLGMGAVAGEKERGAAALVLSKPLTRWAFLLSKLTAQVILYLLGFSLAWGLGWAYTAYLFGPLDVGYFTALNLALLAWLLPYAAITLVGSVVASTTTAAAGAAVGGVILLLILSGIPQLADVMPGALSGWANAAGVLAAGAAPGAPGSLTFAQAGAAAAQFPGGALAASFAILLVCYYLALGLFEQQEL